jgi:hypothetical protein
MNIDSAAKEYHKKNISEAIIEPSSNGNGWRILFHKTGGDIVALTDHSGIEKIYHTFIGMIFRT